MLQKGGEKRTIKRGEEKEIKWKRAVRHTCSRHIYVHVCMSYLR